MCQLRYKGNWKDHTTIHAHTNESYDKKHKLIKQKSKVHMSGWWDRKYRGRRDW